MLERRLTQLISIGVKRAAGQRSIPWTIVVVGAYLLRRALRDPGDVQTIKVKRGRTATISVVDREG